MKADFLKALKAISSIVEKRAPGVPPSYVEAHVLMALENISSHGSIGRQRLSRILKIGEGTVRTMLKRLSHEGLIEISRGGVALTEEGKKILAEFRKNVSEAIKVPRSRITIGEVNVAVLVHGAASAVKKGVEQRDTAIKAGALGATTLIFDGTRLNIPGVEEIEFEEESVHRYLISELKPKRGDVIIIGSADDEYKASLGVKAAAIELLKTRYS
ncbi:hypothetical protein J7L06_04040 [Candidatus Bathyarchaeota archaeon]|nr:hypothetical protein [Candidatus Bathyarchaeota archaeon]